MFQSDAVYDFVVIGAGSSGCAFVHAITDRQPQLRVLVLEAGQGDRSPFITIPAGQPWAMKRHDWGYTTAPDPSRSNRTEKWERGRVLGGSSSINGTMYVRGSAFDFDRWDALLDGKGKWHSRDILPIYHDIERYLGEGDGSGLRGRNGQLHVREVGRPSRLTKAFVASAISAGRGADLAWSGLRYNPDYNGREQEGVGFAQLSQQHGRRCSSADAFLRPALRNRRVDLLLGAHVARISVDNGKATHVEFFRCGEFHKVALRNVVVCGGTINSPQILMLSGIGPPDDLQSNGIAVAIPSPHVGKNLQEHPLVRLVYKTNVPTYNSLSVLQKAAGCIEYLRHGEGPLSNLFEAAGFIRSSPFVSHPDLQLHFLPTGLMPEGSARLARYPACTVLLNKSYVESRGAIQLASNDPFKPPRISYSLLSNRNDVGVLAKGIAIVRAIMRDDHIARYIQEETAPGRGAETAGELADYLALNAGVAYHPVGTCAMGDDSQSVVGPDLKVHGSQNVWVADASIMPDLISGNTNAAAIMIGFKLGQELGRLHN